MVFSFERIYNQQGVKGVLESIEQKKKKKIIEIRRKYSKRLFIKI